MSSEAITRNDLTAILNEVLPSPSVTKIVGTELTTTVPNTTKTNVSSLTLTKGTWLVIFQSAINVGTSKQFQSSIVSNNADQAAEQCGSAASNLVRHNLSWVCTVTEPTTVYGAMYHNAGSTLTINTNDLIAIQLYSTMSTTLNDIADYIVDQGTSDIWTYRKWNSGIAECWGTRASVSVSFNAWQQWYYASLSGIALPFTFIDIPVVTQHCYSSGGDIYATGASIGNAGGIPSTTNTGGITLYRGDAKSSLPVIVQYYVIGRWK